MKEAITQLWSSIVSSITELPEPSMRYAAGVGLIVIVTLFIFIIPLSMCFGFIKAMTELITIAIQGGVAESL